LRHLRANQTQAPTQHLNDPRSWDGYLPHQPIQPSNNDSSICQKQSHINMMSPKCRVHHLRAATAFSCIKRLVKLSPVSLPVIYYRFLRIETDGPQRNQGPGQDRILNQTNPQQRMRSVSNPAFTYPLFVDNARSPI